ncbi:hypothetical protein U0070_014636 [Myodes glareolus]|uniref:Uncharacterized protein n=1 Tax=Myodes glareolus TaxID=447135 RepID=A0AAW0IV25_MYOGA
MGMGLVVSTLCKGTEQEPCQHSPRKQSRPRSLTNEGGLGSLEHAPRKVDVMLCHGDMCRGA